MDNKIEQTGERADRIKKLELLKAAGVSAYVDRFERTHTCAEAVAAGDGADVTTAGRVMLRREMGKITFAHIQDFSGRIQVVLKVGEVDDASYDLFTRVIDSGDFIGVSGTIFTTKKGEISILVKSWTFLTKALLPLPEKWHGLTDEETRYRKRYLDLLQSDELRDLFIKKAKFWAVTRDFMQKKGFLEVETPTLEVTTGGAEARPFTTHHNDFDIDLYLRISVGELWQKRLMAGSFEKIYEIGRVYRNEGTSPDHLQEYTNLEFYWAYANYEDGMNLVQDLYQTIAREVFGTTKFEARGHKFDLAGNWPRIEFRDEVLRQTGIDVVATDAEKIKAKLKELGVEYEGETQERLTDTLWKYCRKKISGPAFLVHLPKLIMPLAKSLPGHPEFTETFIPLIAGSEAGKGYSELNDPLDQRKRFEEQNKLLEAGDEEAMMPDWEFVEMLEHGMPPTCGFGFGERLFSFLADKPIRETQMFPLMRPLSEDSK
ncbi:MAG: lysine--tRNA ligase [Candidatus Paceibacterota bacterium]|jgi:lysyl-tRNA synthetase class 2